MILSIVIILLALLIAYWHYVQGFLTSAISFVCAISASMMALSYYEVLTTKLFTNKLTDMAPGLVICVLFVVVYAVLRTLMDMSIPGNVRVPVIVDRIGAAVLGLVVAVFALGTVVVAAQTLPFGPSIAGYSRYEVADTRQLVVQLGTSNQDKDRLAYDEMTSADFDAAKQQALLLPVDDWVIGFANYCSVGSLAGSQSLAEVHPEYLKELYGQRVGLQVGAKRTAVNNDKRNDVEFVDLFTAKTFPQITDALKGMREGGLPPAEGKTTASNIYLIVRVQFNTTANDEDGVTRLSTGSVRLNVAGTNYFPIGTLHEAKTLLLNHKDDFLHIKTGNGEDNSKIGAVDLVFDVPVSQVLQSGKSLKPDTFLEVKRFARLDLSGKKLDGAPVASSSLSVLRRVAQMPLIADPVGTAAGDKKRGTSTPPAAPAAPVPEAPINRLQPGGADLPPVAPLPM